MGKKFSSQELIDITKKFGYIISNATERYKELYDIVGRCDRETSDIVHDIEFSTFGSKEGNEKAKMLKRVRKERRAAKDEMEFIIKLKKLAEIYKNLGKEVANISKGLEEIRDNQKSRVYTPREKTITFSEED